MLHGFLASWTMLAATFAIGATPPSTAELAYQEAKNFLVNPAMELGGGSIVASGGTLAISSTSGKFRTGKGAQWDSGSASQTLTLKAKQAEAGLSGEPGVGYVYLKCTTGTCTHKLQAYDGTNVLGEQTITSSTAGFVKNFVSFPYSANRVDLRLISVASNEPEISVDDGFIGVESRTIDITQASMVGSVLGAPQASCSWSKSSTGTFSADSDCSTPSATGVAAAPTTKIPGIRFPNGLPAGEYLFVVTGGFYCDKTGAGAECEYNFTDGSHPTPTLWTYGLTASASTVQAGANGMVGRVNLTSAIGDSTFQMNIVALSASTTFLVDNNTAHWTVQVYRFPTNADTGLRVDNLGWRVDANISGANLDLGTGAQSAYVGMSNGSLTLSNNTGNGILQAQIPCTTTNTPSGTTCSAGSEMNGISFNLPAAGDVIACSNFGWNGSVGSGVDGGTLITTFQIVETPANAQTITQEGRTRISSGIGLGAVPTGPAGYNAVRLCGTFSFASAGQKVLRVFYEQSVSGTIGNSTVTADASSSNGQRDIHWEVYPINYLSGAPPRFKGLVTSNADGQFRMEAAYLTNGSGTSNCAVSAQSGTWIQGVTEASAGTCVLDITGAFSAAPWCTLTENDNGVGDETNMRFTTAITSTQIQAQAVNDGSAAAQNTPFYVMCMGPK